MLQLFYRWLIWNSSSPNDINQKCWNLVEIYLKSRPADPFSLMNLWESVCDKDSDDARLVKNRIDRFLEDSWYMRVEDGELMFIDEHLIKDTDNIAKITFTLQDQYVYWRVEGGVYRV